MRLKKGDKVTLRSGGPAMTVVREQTVDHHDTMAVHWFDANNNIHRDTYSPECLQLVEEEGVDYATTVEARPA